MGLGDQRVALDRVHRVDDAIVLRLLGRHEVVPVGVLDDLLERLARVLGEDLVVASGPAYSHSCIWMTASGALPRKPPEPWWIMIRLFGNA